MNDDLVFKALADSTRRLLLDALFERDGRPLGELEAVVNERVEMSRFGVAKHLRILEQAGLVTTRRSGREKLHHLNPVPIQAIHERWIGKYRERAGISSVLLEIKRQAERDAAAAQEHPTQAGPGRDASPAQPTAKDESP